VLRSLLLGNADPKWHSPAVPQLKPRLKPRLQDRTDNTHTKVSPDITTQIISYISELQRKINYYKPYFESSKVLRSLILHKLFKSYYCSGKDKTTSNETIDGSIKPVRDITQWEGCQRPLRDHPSRQTNPEAKCMAK